MHSSEIWGPVTKLLASDFQLITIDLPGFGESAPLPGEQISLQNFALIAQSAIQVLSHHTNIKAVVADSMSAVIVALAAQRGIAPSRLLLSGGPFDGVPWLLRLPLIASLLEISLFALQALPPHWAAAIIRVFAHYTVHNWTRPHNEICRGVLRTNPLTAKRVVQQLKRPLPWKEASELARHICLMVRGKHDRIVSHKTLSSWANHVGAGIQELSNSGHTPMLEEPDKYAQSIRDLMANRETTR
jgi:pimeloyl-ACP methyl ester carboxylesterase